MRQLEMVITMGGLGERFRRAGYDCPKYRIEARGRTLFEWSLLSLAGFREAAAEWIFVALRDARYDVEDFVAQKCAALGIENYHLILLDALTDGQATTALAAQKFWHEENGLLIYNIDTYVEPGAMRAGELKGAGFIPCFRGEGDHWSFVRLDAAGRVVEIREKERISPYCTLGAYYFESCALYARLYREFYTEQQHSVRGERYVAPLYDYLLRQGGEIFISDVPREKVHVLGTPAELADFLAEQENP